MPFILFSYKANLKHALKLKESKNSLISFKFFFIEIILIVTYSNQLQHQNRHAIISMILDFMKKY